MFNERLREERERNQLIQQDVANIVGVSKRTVIDWEKGVSSPTGVQLSALYKKGFNVNYIITGLYPLAPIPYQAEDLTSNLLAQNSYMCERERLLLENFNLLSDVQKDMVEAMIDVAIKQVGKKLKMGM